MELVETRKDHVAAEDILKLLPLVDGPLHPVRLINGVVHELSRKAEVNEVQRHLCENILFLLSLRDLGLEIGHYVVKFQIVVDVPRRVDLLKHGDDVDAELIGAALAYLVPATHEVGLQILTQARHDYIRVFLRGLGLGINQENRSGADHFWSFCKLQIFLVEHDRFTPPPDTFHRVNLLLKNVAGWLHFHDKWRLFVVQIDHFVNLTKRAPID